MILLRVNHFSEKSKESYRVELKCKQIQLDCTKLYLNNDICSEWIKLTPSVVQYILNQT